VPAAISWTDVVGADDVLTVLVPSTALAEAVEALSPRVRAVRFDPADGVPTGEATQAQVLVPRGGGALSDEVLAALPRLKLVQLMSAGAERFVGRLPEGVVLCNARGAHTPSTAEWAVTATLAAQRGIPDFVRAQDAGRWAPSTKRSLVGAKVLIVGAGDIGQLVGRKLLQHPEYGLELVGFVDGDPKDARGGLGDLDVLGGPADLPEIVTRHDVDRVIIAFSRATHEDLLDLVRTIGGEDVQIDVVPRLFDALSPRASVHMVEGLPLVGLTPARIPRSSRWLKRGLDLVGASLLLAAVAPLMLVIAALVRRDSPGPVFFRQVRLGMDRRPFMLLKFRTMRVGTDEETHREFIQNVFDRNATPEDGLYKLDRVDDTTRVGRWLRRTSLDELPQLINVIRGEMSLVGPRPCLPYEVDLFLPHHHERFLVPAGLTGLWQVEARAHSSFSEALDLDVAYVRGWSLGLDLRLLARTPRLMFRKRETS